MPVYGRDENEWEDLVEAGLDFLIERARLGRSTTYTELNATLEYRTGARRFNFERADERAAMGHLLWLIVQRYQERYSEPSLMISALVHYLGVNDAGSGFYALAEQLGLLPRNASKAAKDAFWIEQVNALYQRHRPNAGSKR